MLLNTEFSSTGNSNDKLGVKPSSSEDEFEPISSGNLFGVFWLQATNISVITMPKSKIKTKLIRFLIFHLTYTHAYAHILIHIYTTLNNNICQHPFEYSISGIAKTDILNG